ncbi:MAG: Smg protein [Saprospiraceae bacterium]|jgi:Smg protein
MKENVFDILIYLFEHYMLENTEQEADEEVIMLELIQAGFNHITIDQAFDWLENLAIMCDEHESSNTGSATSTAMRQYGSSEKDRISVEAQGLLLSLEHCGVLNAISREMVIDRLMALNEDEIEISHIKWVILMVLTNCTDTEAQTLEWTEALVLEGPQAVFH